MKTKLWLAGFAVLAFFVIPATAWAGSISGTVTTAPGAPSEEVFTVCAYGPSGICQGVAGGGEYTLSGLAAGQYRVNFHSNSDPRFVSQYWHDTPSYAGATILGLGEEDELVGIDAEMSLGAELHGTVTGTGGAPIEGARACAEDVGQSGVEFCGTTGEAGEYTIVGLPEDSYKLSFEGPPGGAEYLTDWYDGKRTAAEAEVLNLTAGNSFAADATLTVGGAIEGIISGEGSPLYFGEACFYELDETSLGCTFSDGSGEYRSQSLAPGSYVVKFLYGNYQPQYSGGATTFAGATPVQVGAGETAQADADLLRPSGIRGTVVDAETGAPIESGYACAYSDAVGTSCYGIYHGEYELDSLTPATYHVYFEVPGYVTQYYDHVTREAETTPVTVGATMVSGIDAELAPAGSISGHVTNSGGTSLASVKACALTATGIEVECATSDSSGNYQINNLSAGEYKVRFGRTSYITQYYSGKATLEEAAIVSVAARATTSLTTAALVKLERPKNTTAPELTGTARVGETLSCTTGTWANNPTAYYFYWYRGGREIAGAHASTYKLVTADAGTTTKCGVLAENGAGNSTVTQSTKSIVVPALRTLTVTKAGTGSTVATVTSTPAGIECGSTCSVTYYQGESVSLTATPAPHTQLTGWSGACTGTGACTVTLGAANASVTATFAAITHPLTVAVTGGGAVSADSGAISGCSGTGGTCSGSYAEASEVTLTAAPDAHRRFAGWTGCTTVNANQCEVTVGGAAEVTATFEVITHQLTLVSLGGGTVTSAPAGVECPSTCVGEFEEGTTVTLTADPDPHYEFVGWLGEGCPGTGTCAVTLGKDRAFTAEFAQITHGLTVVVVGDGAVSAGSGAISGCTEGGGTCSGTYDEGAEVVLTAAPAAHHVLVGWSGCASTSGDECHVPLAGAESVTATFEQVTHQLSVGKTGSGSGTLTSTPAGIECGSTCAATLDEGTSVTLTAAPTAHSEFTGWSGGGCSGTGTCVVSVEADTAVSAGFAQITHGVSVAVTGDGSVSAGSGAISGCGETGGTCAGTYDEGSEVVLVETPAAHQAFTGWTGCTTSSGGECHVSVAGVENVTAGFAQITHQLGVTKAGSGSGTVTSSPAGIDCGGTCAATFDDGATVTLAATAAAGSEFIGWSGACSGLGPCAVTLGGDTGVVATFALLPTSNGGAVSQPVQPSPAIPSPPAPVTPKPKPKPKAPLQCKKGFKKVKVDGKARCAKVKKGKGRHVRGGDSG